MQPLNKHLETQILDSFCQALAEMGQPKQVRQFLSACLNPEEFLSLAKRLAIAVYLDRGRSYENISANLQVSASDIFQVANNLDQHGLQLALKEVKADQWAGYWSRKIAQTLRALGFR